MIITQTWLAQGWTAGKGQKNVYLETPGVDLEKPGHLKISKYLETPGVERINIHLETSVVERINIYLETSGVERINIYLETS